MSQFVELLADPSRMLLVVASITIAIMSLLAWNKTSKSMFLYAHLIFALSPIFYMAMLLNCSFGMVTGWLSLCTALFAKFVLYILPPIMAASFIGGAIIIPRLLKRSAKHMNAKWFRQLCKKARASAELFIIDDQKPKAFSQGNNVFLSVGVFELLTTKEREAVALHELAHVKRQSSWNKFSALFTRLFSPVAWFARTVSQEEELADQFAKAVQGTGRYVRSAKRKFEEFF